MNDNQKTNDNQDHTPETKTDAADEAARPSDTVDSSERAPRKRRSLRRYFWYLVLVIIIATIAWVMVEKPYQNLDFNFSDQSNPPSFNAKAEVEQLRGQLERTQTNLSQQLTAATDDQSQQQQSAQRQLRQQLSQLQQQLDSQRQQLQELSSQLPEQQFKQLKHWRLFEAKQTVSSAARLLWTSSDYPAALTLLQLADQQVAAVESAQAMEIRQLLAADIARVEGQINQNKQPLTLTLSGLQQRINDLPNRVAERKTKSADNAAAELSSNTQDWRQNLAANWQQFLDNFIRIQPSTEDPEPLLSSAQRSAIDARLNLLLSMAQHALLTESNQLWRQYLDQAVPLIKQLKGDTAAVNDAVKRLTQLRSKAVGSNDKLKLQSLDALAQAVDQGVLQ